MIDMGGLWEVEGADEGDGSMIRVPMRKEARGGGGARVLAGEVTGKRSVGGLRVI